MNGITGLCAVFALTNHGGTNNSIWFDTCAIEQRVGTDWRRIDVPPYPARSQQKADGSRPWFGIASDDAPMSSFLPETCVYFVVEWPRDVPTNGCWRLQLRYGPNPSPIAKKWDDTLGSHWFARRRIEGTIYTPEVRQ